MQKILVSACLLGNPVRYDGASRPCAAVQELVGRFQLVPVCPECLGGLPIPRTASEIVQTAPELRVMSADGEDRTAAFLEGARRCVEVAQREGCTLAIMKAKSPSCGSGAVYDGTFTGALVPGDGVATRLLTSAGVRVISENDVESWLVECAGGGGNRER
ncbi:MAG: DUF523 domain-containing protein [Coriobacteriaceae bacterium]|nr:DUF523 domain-containing protein [Coriobacteriaceae bacterium]